MLNFNSLFSKEIPCSYQSTIRVHKDIFESLRCSFASSRMNQFEVKCASDEKKQRETGDIHAPRSTTVTAAYS